jgi:hypothetical protein
MIGRAVLLFGATIALAGCASAAQPSESQSASSSIAPTAQVGTTSATPTTVPMTTPTTVERVRATTPTTGLPACSFRITVTTDRSTYIVGQPVKITATGMNPGPTCKGSPGGLTNALALAGAAYDSANNKVWDDGAQPNQTGPLLVAGAADVQETVPHNYTDPLPETWNQDRCMLDSSAPEAAAPNPDCPETQVPPGKYTIVVDQHEATITITG